MSPHRISTAALAARWDVSVATIRRMERDGRGPPVIRISRRCVGYLLSDVEAWERAHRNGQRGASNPGNQQVAA
jgi:predicted DNA-binding transcriptional regulator AlpA